MKNRIINFQNKISLTRLFSCILITAILLMSSTFSSQEVLATHITEELKWQLVFITMKACSLHNYQMMYQYDAVAEKYIELYGLEASKYDSICMSESEYSSEYIQPHDLDLIIIVYEKNLGEKVLHSQKMGGLYSHSGSDTSFNHVIMICDCSNFYYSDPFWILSHELSHFVLYFKNYEMSVIEDLIHSNDEQYDQCIEQGINCESYTMKLEIESSNRLFSVMPIHNLGPFGKTGNDNVDDNIRTSVIGISKMITKWWAADKITDGDYANAIGYLVDSDILPSDENSSILIADDPLDDQVTWQEKFSEINANLRNGGITEDNNYNKIQLPNSVNPSIKNKSSMTEQVILGLPDWFKTTAGWWAQEKITDEEFKRNIQFLVKSGILRPHSSDILSGVINEQQTLLEISLQKIVKDIKSLMNSKTLADDDGKNLENKLNLALKKFDFNNEVGGCKQIEGFIESVSEMVDQNKLSQYTGQSLINHADLIKLNFC